MGKTLVLTMPWLQPAVKVSEVAVWRLSNTKNCLEKLQWECQAGGLDNGFGLYKGWIQKLMVSSPKRRNRW